MNAIAGLILILVLMSDFMVMIMKSSNVFACDVGSKRTRFVLLAILVMSVNGAVYAAEGRIAKSAAPNAVLVLSNSNTMPGTGFVTFSVLNSDFPSSTALDPKQLVDIQWSTTYYPDSINEIVDLCYQRTFSSPEDCRRIRPNSSGTLLGFGGEFIGYVSRVKIYHRVLGGTPRYTRPAGVDSIVLRYKY